MSELGDEFNKPRDFVSEFARFKHKAIEEIREGKVPLYSEDPEDAIETAIASARIALQKDVEFMEPEPGVRIPMREYALLSFTQMGVLKATAGTLIGHLLRQKYSSIGKSLQ